MRPYDLIRLSSFSCAMFMTLAGTPTALSQTRASPDKIRGYKVERTVIEVKKPDDKNEKPNRTQDGRAADDQANVDQLSALESPLSRA